MAWSAFIRWAVGRCAPRLAPGALARGLVVAALVLGSAPTWAVDANAASAEQLEEVRGIGPAISARIIAERTRAGAFMDMDDLRERVKGIGVSNLKKFAAAGLTVGAPDGAARIVGKPAARERGTAALRQSWPGRSGVVYYDAGPAPEAARARRPDEPHAPAAGVGR